MSDVYSTDSKFGGAFKGTSFSFQVGSTGIGAGSAEGALVQGLQLSYNRPIQRFWELGSTSQYYVAGRTEGQGQLSQIAGPKGIVSEITTLLGDICKADTNTVTLSAGSITCGGNLSSTSAVKLTLTGVSSQGFNMATEAQSFTINTGMAIMFTTLSVG